MALLRLGTFLLLAWLVRPAPAAAQFPGVVATEHAGIAYFLQTSPAQVARYDLAAQQWLAPVPLAATPTAMTVGDAGLFVAFGRRISRLPLGSSTEQHLQNTAGDVRELLLAGPLVASLEYGHGLLSLDSATGAILDTSHGFYAGYGLAGLSAAPTRSRIFGRDQGLSPPDIVVETLGPGGTFVGEFDSPYHGDYPGASRTFVFPGESKVADDAGIVYATSNLSYVGSLAGQLDDLAFYGELPVVLRGRTLVGFDAAFREVGRHTLAADASRIFIRDATIFAFGSNGSGFTVTIVPVTALGPLTPGTPVDPNGLQYTIDGFVQAVDHTVYVLSRGNQSIFRWLPAQRAYGPTIPLRDVPKYLAYSPVTNRLYVAYPSGTITQIRPDVSDAEEPFATSPQTPCGLATTGEVVFVCDPSGAWSSHFTYTPDGVLVSQVEWNYESAEYVWSPDLRKMYFFRDDTSPNDILWENIDATGHIGTEIDSPYHGDFDFRHPIRIGPGGTPILTGAGLFFDPVTLTHTGSLANDVDDAVWLGDTLLTVRRIAPPPEVYEQHEPGWGVSEVQAWGPGNYPLLWQRTVPGLPRRLFTDGTTAFVVTSVAGTPQWTPFTCGNGVIDAYEQCDGANLGGKSCASLGLGSGPLACTPGCAFDAAGCTTAPHCGDGVVDQTTELCDGADLGVAGGSATCHALGFAGGQVTCQADCTQFVTATCTTCGNGVRDFASNEECDGTDMAGDTCGAHGYLGGTLGCTADCRVITDQCLRDCSSQPCSDDDPCTVDTCAQGACTHDPVDTCAAVTAVTVLGATATVVQNGVTGDCAGRCGSRSSGAIVLPGDGTYRIPSAQPAQCPSESVVIPDEVGVVKPIRRGRERLVPSNLREMLAAVGRCGGFKIKLVSANEWIRRDGDALVDGHAVLVTRERRGRVTYNVRRTTRLAGPGHVVTPPKGFNHLGDCAAGLRLACHAR